MSTCYKTNTTVNTINNINAESKFKARIVEKEKRSSWWEHSFDLTLKYCPSVTPTENAARGFARGFDSNSYKDFALESSNVTVNGNIVTGTFKLTSSCADAAEAERVANKIVQQMMNRDKNLLDGSFKQSSEQKEKVTKFDAWDGVDSYG